MYKNYVLPSFLSNALWEYDTHGEKIVLSIDAVSITVGQNMNHNTLPQMTQYKKLQQFYWKWINSQIYHSNLKYHTTFFSTTNNDLPMMIILENIKKLLLNMIIIKLW